MRSQRNSSYVVVLTGGIASGKTTISRMFESRDVPVIDADIIAHELVEPGKPGLAKVIDAFGDSILTTDGELNRSKLRSLIFSDEESRIALEEILHPLVWSVIVDRVSRIEAPYCLVVIPLFVESMPTAEFADRVLVVDADPPTQLARLIDRDDISSGIAESILSAQASREARLKVADDVITNSGSIIDLERRVDQLHSQFLRLAQTKCT